PLHAWMVAERAARLREHRPNTIFAAAGAPPLQQALRRRRFIALGDHPVHTWGRSLQDAGPIHVGNNTSDTPIFPASTAAARDQSPGDGARARVTVSGSG